MESEKESGIGRKMEDIQRFLNHLNGRSGMIYKKILKILEYGIMILGMPIAGMVLALYEGKIFEQSLHIMFLILIWTIIPLIFITIILLTFSSVFKNLNIKESVKKPIHLNGWLLSFLPLTFVFVIIFMNSTINTVYSVIIDTAFIYSGSLISSFYLLFMIHFSRSEVKIGGFQDETKTNP